MDETELRARAAALPEPPKDSRPPAWEYWQNQLWQHLNHDDPRGFFGWPCVYHTMLWNHLPDAIRVEHDQLSPAIRAKAVLPRFGYPRDYHEPTPYGRSLLHQLYHLQQYQQTTGLELRDFQRVIEFGGGYGAMALMCRRLGFRGAYIIYDLPEYALLQEYYLTNVGVEDVEYRTTRSQLPPETADVLIAGYSLSEVDYAARDSFLLAAPARSYLFVYSQQFESYDNVAYFQNILPPRYPHYLWVHQNIAHVWPGNWYSFAFGKAVK